MQGLHKSLHFPRGARGSRGGLFFIFRRVAARSDGPCRCSSTSPSHFKPFSVHKQFTLFPPPTSPILSLHSTSNSLPISIPFPLCHTRSLILVSSIVSVPCIPLAFNTFSLDAIDRRLFYFVLHPFTRYRPSFLSDPLRYAAVFLLFSQTLSRYPLSSPFL